MMLTPIALPMYALEVPGGLVLAAEGELQLVVAHFDVEGTICDLGYGLKNPYLFLRNQTET